MCGVTIKIHKGLGKLYFSAAILKDKHQENLILGEVSTQVARMCRGLVGLSIATINWTPNCLILIQASIDRLPDKKYIAGIVALVGSFKICLKMFLL